MASFTGHPLTILLSDRNALERHAPLRKCVALSVVRAPPSGYVRGAAAGSAESRHTLPLSVDIFHIQSN
jgi:hypothetical protein